MHTFTFLFILLFYYWGYREKSDRQGRPTIYEVCVEVVKWEFYEKEGKKGLKMGLNA